MADIVYLLIDKHTNTPSLEAGIHATFQGAAAQLAGRDDQDRYVVREYHVLG